MCRRCGNLRSVCSDPDRDHYPFRDYCYITATQEQAWRKVHKRVEKKQLRQREVDGMSIGVMFDDPDPDETFFDGTQKLAAPGESDSGEE